MNFNSESFIYLENDNLENQPIIYVDTQKMMLIMII